MKKYNFSARRGGGGQAKLRNFGLIVFPFIYNKPGKYLYNRDPCVTIDFFIKLKNLKIGHEAPLPFWNLGDWKKQDGTMATAKFFTWFSTKGFATFLFFDFCIWITNILFIFGYSQNGFSTKCIVALFFRIVYLFTKERKMKAIVNI